MGAVSSRLDGGTTLFIKDQSRFYISKIAVNSSRRQQTYLLEPNAYPATALFAQRVDGDDNPVPFIQNPEAGSTGFAPPFFLSLSNDEDLSVEFTFAIRRQATEGEAAADTAIQGLTFIFAPTSKDVDNLTTREFQSDPNLHKNPNVRLVGDSGHFSTDGQEVREFTWKWDWQPPKQAEDRGGGWRTMCTFVEYDHRAHRLETLAAFGFWVQNTKRMVNSPFLSSSPPHGRELLVPPKIRLSSSQSHQTVMSDSEDPSERGLPSPVTEPDLNIPNPQSAGNAIVDVNCARPGEDVSLGDDGPLFRATMKAFEQKTGSMKQRMKKVLKKAEAAHSAQLSCIESVSQFMEALQDTTKTNANAVQPALEHYFQKIAREILVYERENSVNLQRIVIDPLSKLYSYDIKQAESKRRAFEEESKEFYAYVSKYLGQRHDSMKEKKRAEQDTKYQNKRRNFELKRFDYSSFMQDLHGGRKDQEVLSNLTRFADAQANSYLATAKKIEDMRPQLDALVREVREANKEFQIQRTEREEKRRTIEASNKQYNEPDPSAIAAAASGESELARSNSGNRTSLQHSSSQKVTSTSTSNGLGIGHSQSLRLSGIGLPASSGENRFKGIRDLEDKNQTIGQGDQSATQRKEGLVWALSRPGSHVDPRGLNKQAWHKFWLVLDAGRLSEYTNWKEKLELHMEPIDLRLASVREARDSERRFCFEVITPNFKRIYQAQSEDDMTSWISSVNNALQSAYEGRTQSVQYADQSGLGRDIGSVLTGKSPTHIGHSLSQLTSSSGGSGNNVNRRTTVGARPNYVRTDSNSYGEDPTKLLREIRSRDQGNVWCADCGSDVKTEWVSINLGIVLCIECSGIHRSLGTHVSKVRSLTLDTAAFTSDIVEIIMQVGNRISNQIWEARLDQSQKPMSNASRESRLRFISAKYVDRAYVEPLVANGPVSATPDELLIMSVKRNEIQQVLKALALRANANAHDKSRNTHAVFLALAAADPAMPGSSSAGLPSARSPTGSNIQPAKRGPSFPVAELLLQNGGELPKELPAFPLSAAAKQFLEQRRPPSANRSLASGSTLVGSQSSISTGNTGSGGDKLSALPGFGGMKSPAAKERERLKKRDSGGPNSFGIGRAL